MDLVDILFKREYLKEAANNHICKKIRRYNPLLDDKLLNGLTFAVYVAINSMEDLHPMSLYQLNYLCKNKENGFSCIFKLKEETSEFSAKYPFLALTKERFDKAIIGEAIKKSTSKVYICGPPAMNTATSLNLMENGVSADKF